MKKTLQDQPFFIFDVESVGLHGEAFAVAGGIYIGGKPVYEFCFDTDPGNAAGGGADRNWVAENVTISDDHCGQNGIDRRSIFGEKSARGVRNHFWETWMESKRKFPSILMAGECIWPVEARFVLACIDDDKDARNWEGPYPFLEISTMMMAAGMDPMGTYERLPSESPAHDPLADARLSARLLKEAIDILEAKDGNR